MKTIAFLGASGEVTGSSYVVTANDDSQVLVDFGLFQGTKAVADLNYEPLQFQPSRIKGVILTHAHLDHCGRLPLLVYGGFAGKIYMTAPTFALVEIILTDAAKVAQEKQDYTPLYGLDEVEKVLKMVEVVEYNVPVQFGSFTALFKDAGHILGSASVRVTDKADGKSILFSGDIGNTPEDIIKPTEFFDQADIVVMEATYGDKVHPKEDPSQVLREEINAVENQTGVLLIPAFSLERTQEILHRIYHLKKDGLIRKDTPVFMDSPMGIRATEIFRQYRDFYNEELQTHQDDPFSFEGLAVTAESRDSKDIIKAMDPKVIVAGSGMLSGGRIMHHAANYLGLKNTRLLFVGYQAEETLGRRILEGARNIKIKDKGIKVRSHIRATTMSSHADQPKLLTWLGHIHGVKKLFITHADGPQREVFAQKVTEVTGMKAVVLPQNKESYPLD